MHDGLGIEVCAVVAGLGGRAITKASLRGLLERALKGELGRMTFLDLDTALVARELARSARGRSGPHEENMLRDLGVVAARSH